MTATAGMIGVVSWSVQALGKLEQQRTQENTLERLLESAEKDQATVHSIADGGEFHRPPLGAPGNPIVRVALLSQSPPRAVDLSGEAECRFSNGEVVQKRTLKKLFADRHSNLVTCHSGQNG